MRREGAFFVEKQAHLLNQLDFQARTNCLGITLKCGQAHIISMVFDAQNSRFFGIQAPGNFVPGQAGSLTRLAQHHADFEGLVTTFKPSTKSLSVFARLEMYSFTSLTLPSFSINDHAYADGKENFLRRSLLDLFSKAIGQDDYVAPIIFHTENCCICNLLFTRECVPFRRSRSKAGRIYSQHIRAAGWHGQCCSAGQPVR